MQPLGRKSIRFPSKEDCHPPSGYVNWWENTTTESNKTARAADKKTIQRDLEDLTDGLPGTSKSHNKSKTRALK